MANYRKKYPTKVIGNKCMLCQMRLVMGNSRRMWGSDFHHHPTRAQRRHVDLVREGWADGRRQDC